MVFVCGILCFDIDVLLTWRLGWGETKREWVDYLACNQWNNIGLACCDVVGDEVTDEDAE